MELDKIYLGDCYKLIKDIPDKSIDLIYIDVPYDIEGNGGGGCFGERKRSYHKEYERVCENSNASRIYKSALKNVSEFEDIAFGIDYSILDEFVRVQKNIYIYIWCSKKQIFPLMKYFVGEKNCLFEILTWHKTNPIPTCNNKYLSDTEYCLMFREKDKTHIYGTFDTKRKYYVSPINVKDKKAYGHPTIKPLEFVKDHIINSTKEGDVVLDCFMGSGTTAVACKELNRHFIGFELNKEYWEIANKRINGLTNEKKNQVEQLSLFD
jgi:DNA modification methylase